MTSTLPNFTAPPALPPGSFTLDAALGSPRGNPAEAASAPADFADLMSPAAAPAALVVPANPAASPAPGAPAPAANGDVAPSAPAAAAALTRARAVATPATACAPTTVAFFTQTRCAETAAEADAAESVDATDAVATGESDDAEATPVPRETMEAIASLAAALLQALQPPAASPTGGAAAAVADAGSITTPDTAAASDASDAATAPRASMAAAGEGRFDFGLTMRGPVHRAAVPATTAVNTAGTADPASLATEASAAASSVATGTADAAALAGPITVAADGAFEATFELPVSKEAAAGADTAHGIEASFEVQAQLELPGQAVVRVSAGGEGHAGAGLGVAVRREAIFAGKNRGIGEQVSALAKSAERNFVVAADKELKEAAKTGGIVVAQGDGSMSTALYEAPRSTQTTESNPVFAAATSDFSVAQSSPERITEPAAAPAGQPLPERAVAIVTGVVEAQFAASMHRSGTVQLRLKCDGEDLSIRVEMRDGVVRTNFKTDSADLRAAITREWEIVAAQSPESLSRYLAPVFSPAPATLAASTGDGASYSSRQQSAQQDLPQRQAREFAEEAAPFAHRSLLGDTFFPQAREPRVPVMLPTSLRLSALA